MDSDHPSRRLFQQGLAAGAAIEDRKALLAGDNLMCGDHPQVARATKHNGFNGLWVMGLTTQRENLILLGRGEAMLEFIAIYGQVVIISYVVIYSFLGLFWLYLKCASALSNLGSYVGSKYRKSPMV